MKRRNFLASLLAPFGLGGTAESKPQPKPRTVKMLMCVNGETVEVEMHTPVYITESGRKISQIDPEEKR